MVLKVCLYGGGSGSKANIIGTSFIVTLETGSCQDLSPGFVERAGERLLCSVTGGGPTCMATGVSTKQTQD